MSNRAGDATVFEPIRFYAAIEQPLSCRPPRVHCPACGKPAIVAAGAPQPCEHLEFVYSGKLSAFEYQSAAFRRRCAKAASQEVSLDQLANYVNAVGRKNSLLAIEVTYGSINGRPAWHTDVYGFDFCAEE